MQASLGVLLVGLGSLLTTGCLGADQSDKGTEGDASGLRPLYLPINEKGSLDLVPPTAPPRQTSPSCRLLEATEDFHVTGFAVAIEWDAASNRTRELRLAIVTGSADTDESVHGASPLSLTAPDVDARAGGQLGLVVSLLGDEALDPLTEPQTFTFNAAFVAELEQDYEGTEIGMWASECPEEIVD